ncbi:triacylglycerol lipase [Scheffersomyces xylosifermentans]|uniref:triacylglycerol lipase n=1 Tax=Scheffersomyces xylosifermentans TaxID=1304137 RepID=UPI00315DB0AD
MQIRLHCIKFALIFTIFLLSIADAAAIINRPDGIDIHFSPQPKPIDNEIYSNLFTYAHLIDISYCITSIGGLSKPFRCELDCESRFPNMTLVYQWYFDDSVTGYIATTYSNIFNYNDTTEAKVPKKTIIVSLRGTRSIFDTYTDLKVDMVDYSNLRYKLPFCGKNCRVHQGFFEYFLHTLGNVHRILEKELEYENYELLITGHSMGGSVGLLLALHYLDLGYDKMTLVTMGQPLVGNKEFVHWVDNVMGSSFEPKHNTFNRKYFRVIHKNDIVTTIPHSNLLNVYHQFDNQIYLNCSSSTTVPFPGRVVDCGYGDNEYCIMKDFDGLGLIDFISRNYFQSHNTYFRRLGLCGTGLNKH